MKKYIEIQKEAIKDYNINLEEFVSGIIQIVFKQPLLYSMK